MTKHIDDNPEAFACMNHIFPSLENKIRSIYNMGYKDGYFDAAEEATQRVHEKVMAILNEELEGERREE